MALLGWSVKIFLRLRGGMDGVMGEQGSFPASSSPSIPTPHATHASRGTWVAVRAPGTGGMGTGLGRPGSGRQGLSGQGAVANVPASRYSKRCREAKEPFPCRIPIFRPYFPVLTARVVNRPWNPACLQGVGRSCGGWYVPAGLRSRSGPYRRVRLCACGTASSAKSKRISSPRASFPPCFAPQSSIVHP